MKYAAGKRAWGICDRSGLRYPLKDLVPQYRNGVKTGLLVGRDQVDEDHPQNFIGRARTDDAQALRNPRPETTNGREIALRVSYLQGVTGRLTHGVVGFTIDTDADAAPAGLSATVGMGDVSVRADQVFSVTGAQIGSATQSVSVGAGVSVEVTPAGMGLSAVLGTVNAASSLNIIPDGIAMSAVQGSSSAHADADAELAGMEMIATLGGAVAGPEVTNSVNSVSYNGQIVFMINGAYTFTGSEVIGPAISVVRGGTYHFVAISSGLYNSYPMRVSTTSDGTFGGGSQYTAGWTDDPATLTWSWTVPLDAPDTMYYYASTNSGMGNTITVTD